VIFLVDLDGVVWLGDEPIEGSASALEELREAAERVLFTTNNAFPTVEEYLSKLSRCGIDAAPDDVVTSAQAAASLLHAKTTAAVCGGPGLFEALGERDVEALPLRAGVPLPSGGADALVVGYHLDFGYETLSRGAQIVREGAAFIGTNEDPTYPTSKGLLAGTGALLAAFATASGHRPVVAGKPHPPMVELVEQKVGVPGTQLTVIGDRASTDGAFAAALGARFCLVTSGVTPPGLPPSPTDPVPDLVAEDLAGLCKLLEASGELG
jgi:glycerol 3-phosphatase-2